MSYDKKLVTSTKDKRFYDLISDFETENVLFLGTSMTDEIDIDLELLKNGKFITNRFYYVSPTITDAKKRSLSRKFSNILFIEETAETFIKKIIDFNNNVTETPRHSILDNISSGGFSIIKKDDYYDETYLSPSMYVGNEPTWKDIFTNHDVILNKTEKTLEKISEQLNELNVLIITDKSISGKTTLLYRLGAYLSNENLVLQFNGEDLNKSVEKLINCVDSFQFNDNIVILVDDAGWILGNLLELANKVKNYKIIIACTTRINEYQKKFYILTEEVRKRSKIEIVNDIRNISLNDATKFIQKLSEKSYLGKYAGKPEKEAAKLFLNNQRQNDILRSLYEFKEGQHFKVRISELTKKDLKENLNLKRFVLLLYMLEEFGGMGIKLRPFFDFFNINSDGSFLTLINEFINVNLGSPEINKNLIVKSRYNKLLINALNNIPVEEKREMIEDILIYLSNNYYYDLKNSKTYQSQVMYQLLRSQNLSSILTSPGNNICWEEIFKLYKNLHPFYQDFTTYWLHRAISEIKYGLFNDAEIHITQAEEIRKSFEIEHTRSVLYLERALNEKEISLEQRTVYFNQGLSILKNQIVSPLIRNDAYSFHTYIVKACQFYQRFKTEPDNSEIKNLVNYYYNARDKYGLDSVIIRNILRKLFNYLKSINKSNSLRLSHMELTLLKIKYEDIKYLEEDIIITDDYFSSKEVTVFG